MIQVTAFIDESGIYSAAREETGLWSQTHRYPAPKDLLQNLTFAVYNFTEAFISGNLSNEFNSSTDLRNEILWILEDYIGDERIYTSTLKWKFAEWYNGDIELLDVNETLNELKNTIFHISINVIEPFTSEGQEVNRND